MLAAEALLSVAAELEPNIDDNDGMEGMEGMEGTDAQPASIGPSRASAAIVVRCRSRNSVIPIQRILSSCPIHNRLNLAALITGEAWRTKGEL